MLLFKLAYRNVVGRGLRTWLNVFVLSFTYVLIVCHQSIFSGMLKYGSQAMIKDEIAGGQYWHKNYDPFDPISLDDSHGIIDQKLKLLIQNKQAAGVLIRQASIYPEGRIQSVLMRGINPQQKILDLPTEKLEIKENVLPVLIGTRMAKNTNLKLNDYITVRFRDSKGTFDAIEAKITAIMHTNVPTIDNGQLWVPLEKLQKMSKLKNRATMIIIDKNITSQPDLPDWKFKDHDFLLKDIYDMVRSKRVGSLIMYSILLFLAMLAVFDTQVLAIFRRKKEIGTLIALGMSRIQVILLFTLEGAMNGILALGLGAIYGFPWLMYFAKKGLYMPVKTDDYGLPIASRLFPSYSLLLVGGTVFIIMLTTIIVSYLPSYRISKLKPTDALKGK